MPRVPFPWRAGPLPRRCPPVGASKTGADQCRGMLPILRACDRDLGHRLDPALHIERPGYPGRRHPSDSHGPVLRLGKYFVPPHIEDRQSGTLSVPAWI